jgi:hypothetical protein
MLDWSDRKSLMDLLGAVDEGNVIVVKSGRSLRKALLGEEFLNGMTPVLMETSDKMHGFSHTFHASIGVGRPGLKAIRCVLAGEAIDVTIRYETKNVNIVNVLMLNVK